MTVERGRLARNPVVLSQPPRRDRTYRKLGWTLAEARQFLAASAEHRLYAATCGSPSSSRWNGAGL